MRDLEGLCEERRDCVNIDLEGLCVETWRDCV